MSLINIDVKHVRLGAYRRACYAIDAYCERHPFTTWVPAAVAIIICAAWPDSLGPLLGRGLVRRIGEIMSKQSDAKKAQAYEEKPVLKNCANCRHVSVEMRLAKWKADINSVCPGRYGEHHLEKKGARCSIGGFAVRLTAVCNEFCALEMTDGVQS